MKTTTKIIAMAGISLSLTLATGCKKNDDKPEETPVLETTVTNDDAADIVASSISTGASGSSTTYTDAAQRTYVASNASTPCLFSLDTTFSRANMSGSTIIYNYNLNYKYQMYCTNNILTSMVFSLTTSGNIDLPRMSASTSAVGSLTLTGITAGNTAYTANGSYTRNGSATSKIRARNSFTYQLNLSVSNLSILKSNYTVQSGSGNVTISATSSTGRVANFSGTLTYVNATTATLVLNGTTYTINLPNCEANK
jgi:hypothetical protein